MKYRKEKDSLGYVEVPKYAYWGAQTQRSLMNFPKNVELMPIAQIHALAYIKKAAAITNNDLRKLDGERKEAILKACDLVLDGELDDQFPLTVWQTGSGTQSNMNVNEVLCHKGNEIAGKDILHPNDHINMSQSSNDTFPTAMHISTLLNLRDHLYPALEKMHEELKKLEFENEGVVVTGRTHLQDATPLSLSQEISAWTTMIERDGQYIKDTEKALKKLAIGGTAVGTGLNAPKGFDRKICQVLSDLTGLDLEPDDNKFFQLSSKAGMAKMHGALKVLATDLYKMASDIRFLACGPRCGIGELIIPANEPGSSIMPGKVNPTQVESLTMICLQVLGNDTAISMANTQGQLQLNVYMPLIIYNMTQSIVLLSKGIEDFTEKLLKGLKANKKKIGENLQSTLMTVTALSPIIGYDKASEIAKHAYANDMTLKEACLDLGYLSEKEFDDHSDPTKMI